MTDPYAPPPGYAAAPPPPASRTTNVPGVISVILGGVLLVTATVSLFTQFAIMTSGQYELIGVVSSVMGIIQSLLAIGAIATGIIGLTRKGRPKALAGIGLGIGVAVLWQNLGALLYSALASFGF